MSPMGETPIYDQVCGERINADVPASGTDPQRSGYHGKHRLLPDTPVAAVFGPPNPGDGLSSNQHRHAWTYPAGLLAANGQQTGTVGEPQATLPPEAHTRQAPRHAASSPPTAAADRNPAVQNAATRNRGVHPEGDGVRQVKRTKPSYTALAGAQFSGFSAGHDACD